VLCLLLAAVLLVGSCSAPARIYERGQGTVHFDDMVYRRPNIKNTLKSIERLTAQLKAAPDFDTALSLEQQLTHLTDEFHTLRALAFIHNSIHVSDAYFSTEYQYMNDAVVDVTLAVSHFYRELVEGKFGVQYRRHTGDYYFDYLKRRLLFECASVTPYKKEINALFAEYERLLFWLTVEYNGTEYTLDEIRFALGGYPSLGVPLLAMYYEQHMPLFAENYAQIITLYKAIAHRLGFASAADMVYSLQYNRDYTPDEALALFDDVKRNITPLVPYLLEHVSGVPCYSLDTVMRAMPEVLASIDTDLSEAWGFMLEYGLHHMEASPHKMAGAFMIELPVYNAPFIFGNWIRDFTAVTTLLHEFGHFYDHWLRNKRDSYYIFANDPIEFYADGLVILTQGQYNRFALDADRARRYALSVLTIHSMVNLSMMEEFQIRAFALETPTADALGLLYSELRMAYGYTTDYADATLSASTACHDWIWIPHIFRTPFYTAGYVTAAISALQLWELAEQNHEAAVAAYFNMIEQDQNQPFVALLESVSLRSPHDPDVLEDVAHQIICFFDLTMYLARE
jgi:hypothetical protein